MGGSSVDIEALLVDINDPDNPTPGMLPAIFRDIAELLDAAGLPYAVVGRIALTRHEQARFVGDIKIVADLDPDGREHAAKLVQATRARFVAHMDPDLCRKPIGMRLHPCSAGIEARLLSEGSPARDSACRRGWRAQHTCSGFGATPRLPTMPECQRPDRGRHDRPPPRAKPAALDGRRRGEWPAAAASGDRRRSPVENVFVQPVHCGAARPARSEPGTGLAIVISGDWGHRRHLRTRPSTRHSPASLRRAARSTAAA